MSEIASQITSLTIVYSTVHLDTDQRKHQSSASLAFVRGIHRGPVNSPHKWPVTRKMFPFDDVIMWTLAPDLQINWQRSRTTDKNGFWWIVYPGWSPILIKSCEVIRCFIIRLWHGKMNQQIGAILIRCKAGMRPISLIWINFNPCMGSYSHAQ